MKKKAISLILCILLCLGLCIPALGAYNDDVTVSSALDQAVLSYDAANDQTVTLTVSLSKEVSLYSISLKADVPSALTLAGMASGSTDITFEAGENYSLSTGRVSWYKGSNKTATDLIVLTVTVPAGTPAGSYSIGVKEIELATAGENSNNNWMEGGSAYATLTVNGLVASSGATFNKPSANVGVGGSITLTPSLLPVNTDATVSSVTWESSDSTIATVDSTGKVTGASVGTATITAHVTASDNATPWDATCAVSVNASPYEVSIVRNGTAAVHPGDNVTMDVIVSGAAYHGLQATVTYDTSLFTYVSASGAAATPGSGSVELYYNGEEMADGSAAASLTFTAGTPSGNTADGAFGFSYAKACSADSALEGTAVSATAGTSVTVVKQFTVKFFEQDGTTQIGGSILVDAGSSIADVPAASSVANYDFTGWSDGTNTYADADAVKALTISANTSFTATYAPKTFAVSLGTGLSGAATATYGTNYAVTIAGYDANFLYNVTYTVGGGAEQNAVDNGSGNFTIPGGNITGALVVSFSKTLNASVTVHENYVTGYTLITVGSDGTAYNYDGNAMFFMSGKGECAWLVEGEVTQAAAEEKVTLGTAHAGTVTFSNDLNGDGKVDIDDAVVANSVLNKRYAVSTNMAVYLRANVDAYDSYKINAADVNAIITDTNYVK